MRRRINRLLGGGRTVLWDSFTDADGTPLDAHAPNDGVPWMANIPFWGDGLTITNNRLHIESVGAVNGHGAKPWPRGRRNYAVICTLVHRSDTGAATAGVQARMSRVFGSHYVRARHFDVGTDAWNTQQFRLGAFVTIGANVNQALVTDQEYVLRVDVRGGRVVVSRDGSVINQGDAPNIGERSGRPGLHIGDTNGSAATGIHIDNWMVTR